MYHLSGSETLISSVNSSAPIDVDSRSAVYDLSVKYGLPENHQWLVKR